MIHTTHAIDAHTHKYFYTHIHTNTHIYTYIYIYYLYRLLTLSRWYTCRNWRTPARRTERRWGREDGQGKGRPTCVCVFMCGVWVRVSAWCVAPPLLAKNKKKHTHTHLNRSNKTCLEQARLRHSHQRRRQQHQNQPQQQPPPSCSCYRLLPPPLVP